MWWDVQREAVKDIAIQLGYYNMLRLRLLQEDINLRLYG
jgi:hypothetical protein